MKLAPKVIGNCLVASLVLLAVSSGLLMSASRDGESARSLGVVASLVMVRESTFYNDLQRMPESVQATALSARKIASMDTLQSRIAQAQGWADKAQTEERDVQSRFRICLLLVAFAVTAVGVTALKAFGPLAQYEATRRTKAA
jgi:hypothetical protein